MEGIFTLRGLHKGREEVLRLGRRLLLRSPSSSWFSKFFATQKNADIVVKW